MARFFRTHEPDEARRIAEALGARALVLYGGERVRFELESLGAPLYAEPDARIYSLAH